MKKTIISFCILLLAANFCFSQYFGQNKIQHHQFNWKVTSTDHFDIYYYEGMEEIAYFASEVLEDAYQKISNHLSYEFKATTPVLLYRCPNDFAETNVTLELISEGVGGFTEVLKGRVVCPFNGSYEDFRHVIHHELTHAFQFDILYGSSGILSTSYFIDVPLWWMEGMAEYESRGWDLEAEMYIRDLVLSDNLVSLQQLYYYGGYIVYKEGQSVMYFIDQRYGRSKIGEIFYNIKITGSLNQALMKTLNIDLNTFNEEWVKFLNSKYWPKYNDFQSIENNSLRLTNSRQSHNYLNISPSISPDGLNVAYITDEEIYSDIYIMSALTGEVIKKLLGGQRSPQFESLHLLRSNLSWSPDNTKIVISTLSNGQDILWIIETQSGDVIKKLEFDLDIAISPFWSFDNKIYFVGTKFGQTDIYVTDTQGSYLMKITDDYYDDKDPWVSSDGKLLLWVSDRQLNPDSTWNYGNYAVYQKNLETGEIQRLTQRSRYCSNPCFAGDSNEVVLFLASYCAGQNIFKKDLITGELSQLTNVPGEIVSFSIDRDADRIILNAYDDGRWDIFSVEDPLTTLEPVNTKYTQCNFDQVHTEMEYPQDTLNWEKPGLQISPDWGQASVAYTNIYGMAGMITLALSDIMGNHRILFQSDLNQNIVNSNFNIVYYYLARRWDLGMGIYQQHYAYWDTEDTVVAVKYLGGGFIVLYPFNRFQRVDFSFDAYYQEKDYYFYNSSENDITKTRDTTEVFITPGMYYVYDNTVWGFTSPFVGTRLRMGGGVSHQIKDNSQFYYGSIDIRKYWRVTPRSNFAARMYCSGVGGNNPPDLHLGGNTSLRGYDWNEIGGQYVGMINLEARFPFMDNFEIIFPLPLMLGTLRGCLFTDIGTATSDLNRWQAFSYNEEGIWGLEDLKFDMGFGLRMYFWTAVLKFDVALPTDFRSFDNRAKIYVSIGEDF